MFISHFFKQGVFILKDFRNFKFSSNITSPSPVCQGGLHNYVSTLRGNGKMVFNYIHKMRDLKSVKVRNATIAKSVGCTIRTVQRWTSEFAKIGIITKHRAGIFETNQYKNHIPRSMAFTLWFNGLSKHDQDMYMTHGIVIKKKKEASLQYETVIPITNPFPNPIYLQTNPNPIAHVTRVRYARARTIQTEMGFGNELDGDGVGFLSEKERNRAERVLKGIEMLNQEHKNWLMANGTDPRVKEYVLGPKVKHLLITPTILALTTLLKLDEREQLKLVAYPDEVLENLHLQVKGIVEGTTKSAPIRDRMAWFLWMANEYCKKKSLNVDWRWYFEIAKILGIEALQPGEPPKPLVVNKSAPKWESKSSYSSSKPAGKATDYANVSFSFPPMTREQYNDPVLSRQYYLDLKEHNKRNKTNRAQEYGDTAEITALNIYDTTITKQTTPGQYRFTTDLYRSVPDKLKQEWLDNPEMIPDTVAEPLAHVLKEFQDGIVISATPDNILTEISKKLSIKEQLAQITDYSHLEEEFDIGFL